MEELSRPVWQDQPPARNAAVEEALASLIAVHGYSLFTQAGRLRRLLTEAAPDAPRHIAVVIVALSAEIPQRASRAKSDAALAGALQEWVQYLQTHASLDAAWATWAVAVWAHAIGLPTIALGVVMDADTFPSPTGTRAPFPGPGAGTSRTTDGAVRAGAGRPTIEAAFTNRRAEPSVGRPAGADHTASGNLIDPLFPEQRSKVAAGRDPIIVEPSAARPAPARSSELPVRDRAAAVPPPPDSRVVRLVIGGFVLVAIGVAIGFALSAAIRPEAPVASTAAAPTVATHVPPPEPVPDVPKPTDPAPSQPPQATRPVDEPLAAPLAPAPPPTRAADVPAAGKSSRRTPTPAVDPRSRSKAATASKSCTAETCGTVVSTRELGDNGTAFAYDILVRMDNRETRSFAARYRLQSGSRVRMSGDRFVPLDSRRERLLIDDVVR